MLAGEALREALICPDPGVLEQDVRGAQGERGAPEQGLLVHPVGAIPQVLLDRALCRDIQEGTPNSEEVRPYTRYSHTW